MCNKEKLEYFSILYIHKPERKKGFLTQQNQALVIHKKIHNPDVKAEIHCSNEDIKKKYMYIDKLEINLLEVKNLLSKEFVLKTRL